LSWLVLPCTCVPVPVSRLFHMAMIGQLEA
jgi:hypothetical protein